MEENKEHECTLAKSEISIGSRYIEKKGRTNDILTPIKLIFFIYLILFSMYFYIIILNYFYIYI